MWWRTRVFDVGCKVCGEVWQWGKYGPPDSRCPRCGTTTSITDSNGNAYWNRHVQFFGVSSPADAVEQFLRKPHINLDELQHFRMILLATATTIDALSEAVDNARI